jgi:hypothetical protein
MSTRFQQPIMQALDDTGVAVVGSRLFFYDIGTTTFLDTYQDRELTTPNSNPVEAVAGGRFPDIWLQEQDYTVRFTIPNNGVDVDVWSVDITGVSLTAASVTTAGIVRLATVAEMIAGVHATAVPSVQNVTQNIKLDAARIQSGIFNSARLPTATAIAQGAVLIADAADILAGTAGRMVDAAQLAAATGTLSTNILLRIVANNTETGQAPTGTSWIGDSATSPTRPNGGVISDVHVVGGGGENRSDQLRYSLVEWSINNGVSWTAAPDSA